MRRPRTADSYEVGMRSSRSEAAGRTAAATADAAQYERKVFVMEKNLMVGRLSCKIICGQISFACKTARIVLVPDEAHAAVSFSTLHPGLEQH
jgi:hypothetical protein